MFLKKVVNQPNLVGAVMITLMICSGFVYAVGFDGFNVETATGGEVEAWLAATSDGSSGGNRCSCGFANCQAANPNLGMSCSNCTKVTAKCKLFCGTCSCPDMCSNIHSFFCKQNKKTKACNTNP